MGREGSNEASNNGHPHIQHERGDIASIDYLEGGPRVLRLDGEARLLVRCMTLISTNWTVKTKATELVADPPLLKRHNDR